MELDGLPDSTPVGVVELVDVDVLGVSLGLIGGTDETEVGVDGPAATEDELATMAAEVAEVAVL